MSNEEYIASLERRNKDLAVMVTRLGYKLKQKGDHESYAAALDLVNRMGLGPKTLRTTELV